MASAQKLKLKYMIEKKMFEKVTHFGTTSRYFNTAAVSERRLSIFLEMRIDLKILSLFLIFLAPL